uniref:CAP domain-containing protein n=1 Tax=Paraburkholderia fungorum TaxID=134537 RepID=UPI0038B852B5
MGVGQISQDAALDTAAQAHTTYLNANLINGSLTALSHDEVSTYANVYADTPLDRARKAGVPATEWIGEDVGDSALTDPAAAGTDCVNRLFATVYHLASLTSTQQTIGIGFTPASSQLAYDLCTFDFGSSTNVYGTPTANAIPSYGGQQMASTSIAHAPLSNQTNVALAMTPESPSPASDIATPGHPLLVRVRADQFGDVLTVSSFTLTDASGASVTGRILIPATAQSGSTASAVPDPNSLLGVGVVVFLPSQPLAANTVYTATFSGARDGTPVSVAWSFTTGAN